MKNAVPKDFFYVGIQLLLFIIYFTPLFSFSLHPNDFIKYTSLLFAIVGLLIILLAILQLNKNLTPFPTPKENGTLIKSGLYKFVRHPIYSGIILSALGFGVFYGSLWKICIGFTLWILFHFKSAYEEILLSGHFADYEAYRKMTKRFFPFL